jgi:hypothetical protein
MMNLRFTIYDLRSAPEIKRRAGTLSNPHSAFRIPQFIVPSFAPVVSR